MATSFKIRTKTIPLSFMGEEWGESYLVTRFLSVRDNRLVAESLDEVGDDNVKAIEKSLEVVKNQFVSGKTVGEDGQLVDISADDLDELLDASAVMEVFGRVMGTPDPKASTPSPITTQGEGTNPTDEANNVTAKPSDSATTSSRENQ